MQFMSFYTLTSKLEKINNDHFPPLNPVHLRLQTKTNTNVLRCLAHRHAYTHTYTHWRKHALIGNVHAGVVKVGPPHTARETYPV